MNTQPIPNPWAEKAVRDEKINAFVDQIETFTDAVKEKRSKASERSFLEKCSDRIYTIYYISKNEFYNKFFYPEAYREYKLKLEILKRI
jgi:hypothetical protein